MDPWQRARQTTQARIGLGVVGHAIPTRHQLAFQLAHARARDAVHAPWDLDAFEAVLRERGVASHRARTRATSRVDYLLDPVKGRRLHPESVDGLQAFGRGSRVVLLVSNGLSSTAVHAHGMGLLVAVLEATRDQGMTPAVIGAEMVVMILGERPGLSSADSLGMYLTFHPRHGNTDANRNCLSNIHPPHGMTYTEAAQRIVSLMIEAKRLGCSGVMLKDRSDPTNTRLEGGLEGKELEG
jgi:ethanolamine ammonia-lyase small subunit